MLTILLVVVLVLALAGGIPAWNGRATYGAAPAGLLSVLVVAILVILLLRLL
jgi:hypothetical protein